MKAEIDSWFSDNYSNVLEITTAWVYKYGRTVEPDVVVSNCYLYLLKRSEDMAKDDIPKWAFSYINTELTYSKSVTNYASDKLNKKHEDIDTIPYIICDDFTDEIDFKILLNDFRTTLSRVDQIIWDVYVEKGVTTKRDLAKHFNIDDTSAWLYMNEIKTKFKEYVETEERL